MLTRWRLLMNRGVTADLRLLARQKPPQALTTAPTDARRQRLLHASPKSPEKNENEKVGKEEVEDRPLPFLESQAHKFNIRQEYVASEEEVRRSRYAIPLGFSMFAIIMYFGYIRQYGEKDKAIVDFLTKDISDKIPPRKLKQIKQAIEEDSEISKR